MPCRPSGAHRVSAIAWCFGALAAALAFTSSRPTRPASAASTIGAAKPRCAKPSKPMDPTPSSRPLAGYSNIYLSGISLAVLKPQSRGPAHRPPRRTRQRWRRRRLRLQLPAAPMESVAMTRAVYEEVIAFASRVLVTVEELEVLGNRSDAHGRRRPFRGHAAPRSGDQGRRQALHADPRRQGRDRARHGHRQGGGHHSCRRQFLGRPICSAAALGLAPTEAARRGHIVAGAVVQHRGAIIPKDATPDVFASEIARRR